RWPYFSCHICPWLCLLHGLCPRGLALPSLFLRAPSFSQATSLPLVFPLSNVPARLLFPVGSYYVVRLSPVSSFPPSSQDTQPPSRFLISLLLCCSLYPLNPPFNLPSCQIISQKFVKMSPTERLASITAQMSNTPKASAFDHVSEAPPDPLF